MTEEYSLNVKTYEEAFQWGVRFLETIHDSLSVSPIVYPMVFCQVREILESTTETFLSSGIDAFFTEMDEVFKKLVAIRTRLVDLVPEEQNSPYVNMAMHNYTAALNDLALRYRHYGHPYPGGEEIVIREKLDELKVRDFSQKEKEKSTEETSEESFTATEVLTYGQEHFRQLLQKSQENPESRLGQEYKSIAEKFGVALYFLAVGLTYDEGQRNSITGQAVDKVVAYSNAIIAARQYLEPLDMFFAIVLQRMGQTNLDDARKIRRFIWMMDHTEQGSIEQVDNQLAQTIVDKIQNSGMLDNLADGLDSVI